MRNKFTSAFCTLILACCFSLTSINNVIAQENGIYELTEDNQSSKQITNKKGNNKDRKDFYNFYEKLHSTFYYENNKLKNKYGKGSPLKLTIEDANSFDSLYQNDSKHNKVRLITITLKNQSDLNKTFDLTKIKGFSKLKYIYVKCLFNCNSNQVKKFIKRENHKVRVFYTSVRSS